MLIAVSCIAYSCRQRSHSADTSDQPAINKVKGTDDTNKTTRPDQLIIPGKSIGKIVLNGNADSAVDLLGKPDFSDAAMGSVLITWYVKHDTAGYKTSIFANHNFGAKDDSVARIRKILVTSPDFKTAEGLNTGLPLSEYQKHYDLKQVSAYTAKGQKILVYEAKNKGIAFEVNPASNRGAAIVVYKPGDTPATYINMH